MQGALLLPPINGRGQLNNVREQQPPGIAPNVRGLQAFIDRLAGKLNGQ